MGRDLGLRIGRARCDATESDSFVRCGSATVLFDVRSADVARRTEERWHRHGPAPAPWRPHATDDPIDAFHSLLLLLESTGEDAVLLGIDDVQWADPASVEWLQFLARRLTTSSVHLVMTTRSRRAGRSTASDPLVSDAVNATIRDAPLTIESTTAMITRHLGAEVTSRIAARAHQVTGGEPAADCSNALCIGRSRRIGDHRGPNRNLVTSCRSVGHVIGRHAAGRCARAPRGRRGAR